ncbi:peptidoglycan/xylan/chitin deacetylase, PgdA/CDA1 family [Terrimicrobium sacchariphilum]|uniref:Peptidoglycan/xylan/chitin deacetylase, PgdA/CDA1 family n=1 Tax=Terrimicrobium sacchariphilum TaxID=690879 RepID=A0A146GA53_TERSA|nr:polysaccharide deacetylase family protein [Terrimicrobium sacchariphilum]GAT34143.1 peptidoglycan/xylan/chitin deacetylase, PgdA/CDA1 family [Terrimicrobium sacchariphilum]
MIRFLSRFVVGLALVSCAMAMPLQNPGFENGLEGWILLERDLPDQMTSVATDAAREGSAGLRVEDTNKQAGSSLVSQPMPASPGLTYKLAFYARAKGANKGAVYLRFYDSSQKIIDPQNLPNVAISKAGDWENYTLDAVAPAGTAAIAIWIHSWSGATGTIEFDDFSLEEVGGSGASTSSASVPVASVVPASKPSEPTAVITREKPAMIVLKLDDLKVSGGGRLPTEWQRVLDILKVRNIKASFGIICDSLAKADPSVIQWIKDAHQSGLVEFWFHGLNHDVRTENGVQMAEFKGRPYDEQKRRFEESESLVREKLGFTLVTFGPPGGGTVGSFDEATIRVMNDVPEMKVWLYPQPLDEAGRQVVAGGKVVILDREWPVNIEQPLFVPNAEKLERGYAKYPQRAYFVLQGHPTHWKDEGFVQFEKILDFLQQQNAVFVTPTECAAAVEQKTAQAN